MGADREAGLNEGQRAAVTAGDGPTLVIAAAGTGKTHTLTHRLAWLMEERGVPGWRIRLLTFTNRAAREMLERAEVLVGAAAREIVGGTFHHVANGMLRRHAEEMGFARDFTILDADDSERLIKAAVAEGGYKKKELPKPGVLAGVCGLAVNRCGEVRDELERAFGDTGMDVGKMEAVWKRYGELKAEQNAMDFDDLLVNAVRLLREFPAVAEAYQERILHVLVDEYQDTNRLQSEFVDLLAARHKNLMAVGDDFQSIYSWRGADIRQILTFEQRYPGARVIKLEENYRSVPGILALANRVIEGNPEQYQKVLRASREGVARPTRAELGSGAHQAKYVCGKIKELVEAEGLRWDEIAVLYRAHFHSMELQMEMDREGIPYVTRSGLRYFEQAHIKDACALLRLALNPADFTAFDRLAQLFSGVGEGRAKTMWRKMGGSFAVADGEARAQFAAALPKDAREEWAALESALFPPGEAPEGVLKDPCKTLERFCSGFYRGYAKASWENAERRLEDIREFSSDLRGKGDTRAVMEELALLTNLDTSGERSTAASGGGAAVQLSTVHQAKGLEWKVVFVLWMVDGRFPSSKAAAEGGLAEERRLFYVAVTRAKDRLWLCVPKTMKGYDGRTEFCSPSEFLDELDPELTVWDEPPSPMAALGRPAWRSW